MPKNTPYYVVIAKGKNKGKRVPRRVVSPPLRNFFEMSLKDVDALIETYRQLNPNGKGRSFGHITRSAVIMLCAAWEQFIEESLQTFVWLNTRFLESPQSLPKPAQKSLCQYILEKSKHELRILDIAGDGWKKEYEAMFRIEREKLHSPNSFNIDPLFECYAGIENISSKLKTKEAIDKFVKTRGDIAHAGSRANYVRIADLKAYRNLIFRNVSIIEQLLQIRKTTLRKTFKDSQAAHIKRLKAANSLD